MGKTIVLIHGRSTKPNYSDLKAGWIEAIRHGLERDRPDSLDAFNDSNIAFIYYGDINNQFLDADHDLEADAVSRKETLDALKKYEAADFRRDVYERLPGKSSFAEAVTDALAGTFAFLRISEPVIEKVAPDMAKYWNPDSQFGSDVRFPIIAPLKQAMDDGDKILVIAHSLGTMIAYDTFWKFSHMGEYRPKYTDKEIDLWVTLGCPLGDETVKRNLKGAGLGPKRRYPSNIRRWINIAAEDDFISHDQTVKNDFREMREAELVDSIEDVRVFNLAVRHGRSNPHHGPGYLVHPKVAEIVADWLAEP